MSVPPDSPFSSFSIESLISKAAELLNFSATPQASSKLDSQANFPRQLRSTTLLQRQAQPLHQLEKHLPSNLKSENTSQSKKKHSSHRSNDDKKRVLIYVPINHLSYLIPPCTFLCLFLFFSNFVEYQRLEMCPWLTSLIFLKPRFLINSSEVTSQTKSGPRFYNEAQKFIYAYQSVTSERNKILDVSTISRATSIRPSCSHPPAPG